MSKNPGREDTGDYCRPVDISDDDVYDAMKEIPGYLDITPGDFKEVYRFAYQHAVERLSSVKAGDAMVREVVTVTRKTPLVQVAEVMAGHGISGVPVVEEGERVVGVISEKDFLARMGEQDAKTFMGVVAECLKGKGCVAVPIKGQNAEDIMTSPAVTVNEETSIMEIASILTGQNINRVPVIDRKGHLVGIISRADIVRHHHP
jgi:CBS-domain-containing membrane protein